MEGEREGGREGESEGEGWREGNGGYVISEVSFKRGSMHCTHAYPGSEKLQQLSTCVLTTFIEL